MSNAHTCTNNALNIVPFSARKAKAHPRLNQNKQLTRANRPVSDSSLSVAEIAAAHIARADAYFDKNLLPEAIEYYRHALDLMPRNAHALHRLGLACFRNDQMELARVFLNHALHAAPERADICEHCGLTAALAGDLVAAEAFYRRAITLTGGTATLYRNLADCLRLSRRVDEAMIHYAKALELDPTLHHAAYALAEISTECGRSSDAVDHWQRAWSLDHTHLRSGLGLISALNKAKRDSEIDAVVARMRADFAADAIALKELSYALNCIDRFREAISIVEQGLVIDPNNAWLHHNAAYGFSMLGEFPAFKAHSIEAARLMPDDAVMQSNLANAQLLFAEFEQGWAKDRWREKMPVNSSLARPNFPEWQGEPLSGKKFLLLGEQGLGDQIQFLRMAAWLHRQGATVDVWVDVPLGELACGASGVDAAWVTRPAGPYDYWSRMLRVPEYAKIDFTTLPVAMPYLAVTPEKQHQWQTYLEGISRTGREEKEKQSTHQRIGLVWAGNPDYANDRYRSIKLNALQSVLAQPGVSWYSVQKGHGERDSEPLAQQFDMHTLGPVIRDFTDTLAILHSLDLLITIDSSVAHLAGAAGLPVWVLVPAYANWRWLTDGTHSPWYPSMRLFRQRELGDWNPVIEEVRNALREWCATHASSHVNQSAYPPSRA